MINSFQVEDTIAAQATANEPGYERGIIRISGPETLSVLDPSFESNSQITLSDIGRPEVLAGQFSCNKLSIQVPVELLLWPTSKSYTRQVTAEIHTLGSQPILSSIMEQLLHNGARLAQPGEFTFRAFLSGRIDLVKAEAVLGVIDARDQNQLNLALQQLSGGISTPLGSIRNDLITTLANLEAGLDFVEEDIEFVSKGQLLEMISRGLETVHDLKSQLEHRNELETNFRAVLFGSPNAGKSSLFNAIIKRYGQSQTPSIVSDRRGTTRDFVSSRIELDGIQVTLIDTAGVEPEIPKNDPGFPALDLGQKQSILQSEMGNIEIFCIDSSKAVSAWERDQLEKIRPLRIVCFTKSDRRQDSLMKTSFDWVITSAHSGEGIELLAKQIRAAIDRETETDPVAGTAVRCKESVMETIRALNRANELVEHEVGDEFVSSEIRIALQAIGKITGTIYTDDILDVIFRQFCIGK